MKERNNLYFKNSLSNPSFYFVVKWLDLNMKTKEKKYILATNHPTDMKLEKNHTS